MSQTGWFAQLGRPGGKKGDVKGRVFAMSVALAGAPSSEAARGAVSSYKTAASPFLCLSPSLEMLTELVFWVRCHVCTHMCCGERVARSPSLGGLRGVVAVPLLF